MASVTSAGDLHRGRDERQQHAGATSSAAAEAMDVAPAEGDVREQVERGPAEQRHRRHELQRIVHVPERLLQPERHQHDAGDHREVQVGEGVARDLVLLAARLGVRAAGARRPARRRRSRATTARPRPRCRARRRPPRRRPRRSSAPTPMATIDSPSAMITISPWRSAKWLGRELPALGAEHVGPADVEEQGERPQAALEPAVGERGGHEQADPDRGADGQPARRSAAGRVVAARDAGTGRCAPPRTTRRRRRTAGPRSPNASGTHSDDHEQAPPSPRRSRSGRAPPRDRRRS